MDSEIEIEVQNISPEGEPETVAPAAEQTAATGAATPEETRRPTIPAETLTSLMRLAVGGTILGAQLVRERLQSWETAHPPRPGQVEVTETRADRTRFAMMGLMFHAYETGRKRLAWAIEAGTAIGSLGLVLMKPVTSNPLLSPARRRVEKMAEVGSSRVEAWINTGRNEEQRSRRMANDLFQELVQEVTVFLGENEAVDTLINQVADELLGNLTQDPQVEELIRVQGNNYLVYLQEENAEQVQQLIQGQSLDMAGQVLDEVRERTVTADSIAERLVRALLRRAPREDLPSPPPEVQRWANAQPPSAIIAAEEKKGQNTLSPNQPTSDDHD